MNRWITNKFYNRTKFLVTGIDKENKSNKANFGIEDDYYNFLLSLSKEKIETMSIKIKTQKIEDDKNDAQKNYFEILVDLDGNYYKDSYYTYHAHGVAEALFARMRYVFPKGLHFGLIKYLLFHTEEELSEVRLNITYNKKIEDVSINICSIKSMYSFAVNVGSKLCGVKCNIEI